MKIACSCEPLVNVDTHKTDDLKYANQGDQYLEEIFYCTTCNETR